MIEFCRERQIVTNLEKDNDNSNKTEPEIEAKKPKQAKISFMFKASQK